MISTKRLSVEDREKVAGELRYPFGRVELQCDQYRVSLHVRACGERRQTIVVYIDGWVRGKWLIEDCDERCRFMRAAEGFLYSARSRADFLKHFGKRAFKRSRLDAKVTHYEPNWNSVTSMLRQFQRTCASVELVAIGYTACNSDVRIETLSDGDIGQPHAEETNA